MACCKVKHCHHACTVCLLQPLLHGEEIRDIVPDCQVRPVYDTDHRRLDAQQDALRTQQVHRRANPRPAHSLDGAAFEQPGLRLPNVRYLRFLHVASIRYTSVCWFCAEKNDYFLFIMFFFNFYATHYYCFVFASYIRKFKVCNLTYVMLQTTPFTILNHD